MPTKFLNQKEAGVAALIMGARKRHFTNYKDSFHDSLSPNYRLPSELMAKTMEEIRLECGTADHPALWQVFNGYFLEAMGVYHLVEMLEEIHSTHIDDFFSFELQ